MSTPKIIFVNGAPGSGKDTFWEAIVRSEHGHQVEYHAFKEPLINTAQGMSGTMLWDWGEMYTREEKEKPQARLHGMSPREMLIWISEEVMKPKFGKDVFGKLMVKNINDTIEDFWEVDRKLDAIIIPDAGFKEEIEIVVKKFGQENCAIVNVIRPDHDFSNDSRSLIKGEDVGIKDSHILFNTEDLDTFKEGCIVVYEMIMGIE